MPRYFFHIREGAAFYPDDEGQELVGTEAARREAIRTCRELVAENILHGGAIDHRTIEITDEQGQVVGTVTSKEILFGPSGFANFSDDVTQSAPKPLP